MSSPAPVQFRFSIGEAVPWFFVRSSNNPRFNFASIGGRYCVLSLLGSGEGAVQQALVAAVNGPLRHYFDDHKFHFMGLSVDPRDESEGRLRQSLPGIRYLWDFDHKISILYRAMQEGSNRFFPITYVLDPALRVIAALPMQHAETHVRQLSGILRSLPAVEDHAEVKIHAPVAVIPRVFERPFCRELIELFDRHGGETSGFMREIDGRTVPVHDQSFKKREDFRFEDQPEYEELRASIRHRLMRRLLPEIKKIFQYDVTRIERYIVACYDSESGGFFRPHRDNTTAGTAHRRFACTLNLNAEDYDGGELRFPEFGSQTYRAPTGGAVIFSCSLLHEATAVTRGKRYAFLPFFYDDAAAEIRKKNLHSLQRPDEN